MEKERIEAIVRRMPRITREIFLAHRLEGLSYEDIARRTGVEVSQVERHIGRALILLDRELAHERRRWWRFW
jgi:RNA polymerase sigma-70 factor (ECF subfamily)